MHRSKYSLICHIAFRALEQESWFCILLTTLMRTNKRNAGTLSKGMDPTASHSSDLTRVLFPLISAVAGFQQATPVSRHPGLPSQWQEMPVQPLQHRHVKKLVLSEHSYLQTAAQWARIISTCSSIIDHIIKEGSLMDPQQMTIFLRSSSFSWPYLVIGRVMDIPQHVTFLNNWFSKEMMFRPFWAEHPLCSVLATKIPGIGIWIAHENIWKWTLENAVARYPSVTEYIACEQFSSSLSSSYLDLS